MVQEFLGPEYRLFKEKEVRTVAELIAKHPEKKDDLIKHLGANVDVLVQKGTFNHSLVHTVLHNYLAVTDGKRRADCIESIRDQLIHMLHSRWGVIDDDHLDHLRPVQGRGHGLAALPVARHHQGQEGHH